MCEVSHVDDTRSGRYLGWTGSKARGKRDWPHQAGDGAQVNAAETLVLV